ncbi:unnamed protein product, partial [Discosporangium mesarthrocarpum]
MIIGSTVKGCVEALETQSSAPRGKGNNREGRRGRYYSLDMRQPRVLLVSFVGAGILGIATGFTPVISRVPREARWRWNDVQRDEVAAPTRGGVCPAMTQNWWDDWELTLPALVKKVMSKEVEQEPASLARSKQREAKAKELQTIRELRAATLVLRAEVEELRARLGKETASGRGEVACKGSPVKKSSIDPSDMDHQDEDGVQILTLALLWGAALTAKGVFVPL